MTENLDPNPNPTPAAQPLDDDEGAARAPLALDNPITDVLARELDAQAAAAGDVFVAAKLRASDGYLGFGAEWVYQDEVRRFKIARVPAEHGGWFASRLRSGLDAYGPRDQFPSLVACIAECKELADLAEKLRLGTATEEEREEARVQVVDAKALKAARSRKEQNLRNQARRSSGKKSAPKDGTVLEYNPASTASAPGSVPGSAPGSVPGSVPHQTVVEPADSAAAAVETPVETSEEPAAPATPATPAAPAAAQPRSMTVGANEARAPKGTLAAFAVNALRKHGINPLECSARKALEVIVAEPAGSDGQAQAKKTLADPGATSRFAGYWEKRLAILRSDVK